MPTENENKAENLIDVGEADQQATEINLDDKGEPEKIEAPVEEKIEVEQVPEDKSFENERETKLNKKEDKDELKEYSDGVQKRIAKLTRKMREAERQREEAITFANSMKANADRLENKMSTLDKSYVKEFESRVTTNMDAARQSLRVAIEAGDVDGQVKAQEQIARLAQDASRLGALKDIAETPREKEVATPAYEQPRRRAQSDPKAEEWAAKNTWFGNDSAMTHTALDLHKVLVEEEGYDPKSDEYYEEVEKRIKLEFPHKFDKMDDTSTERVRPTQNVASAKRSASTGRKKTVKLTPSQVAIAKRLGVPLEAYAKQLKITEGA
jgi:hypothetical protein